MKTLKSLFLNELRTMYDAEHRTIKAWPKIVQAALSSDLKEAIRAHCKESHGHIKILERVFKLFGTKPKARVCAAAVGHLIEANRLASLFRGSPAIDAALISAAQKAEHYEIAAYGCLHEWARLLGNQEAVFLLQEVLDEEKAADETLTELALRRSNREALETSSGQVAHNGQPKMLAKEQRGNISLNGNGSVPRGNNIWFIFGHFWCPPSRKG